MSECEQQPEQKGMSKTSLKSQTDDTEIEESVSKLETFRLKDQQIEQDHKNFDAEYESISFENCDELEEHFREKMDDAKALFHDDKLFKSHGVFIALRKKLREIDNGNSDIARLAHSLKKTLKSDDIYVLCVQRIKQCTTLLQQIENDDGWTKCKESNGITTMYREEEEFGTHSFKCRAHIEADLFHVAAVIYELDLYKNWFPFLKKSKTLSTVSRFRKYGHLESKLPFPISNRDVVIDGYGVDNLENNYCVVFVKSLTPEHIEPHVANDFKFPKEKKSVVRAIINFGGFLVRCISPTITDVQFMINVDPKLAIVPYWLINLGTGQFIYILLDAVRKAAKFDEKSEYAKRIHDNKEVYGYMKEMTNEYWEKRGVDETFEEEKKDAIV